MLWLLAIFEHTYMHLERERGKGKEKGTFVRVPSWMSRLLGKGKKLNEWNFIVSGVYKNRVQADVWQKDIWAINWQNNRKIWKKRRQKAEWKENEKRMQTKANKARKNKVNLARVGQLWAICQSISRSLLQHMSSDGRPFSFVQSGRAIQSTNQQKQEKNGWNEKLIKNWPIGKTKCAPKLRLTN